MRNWEPLVWALLVLGCGSDGAVEGNQDVGSGLPGSSVYQKDQILEFRFTVSESDWASLREHGNEEVYVPAGAAVSGSHLPQTAFSQVGLRHKGNYTLHHCWDEFGGVRSYQNECAKLSFKVKFDEFNADGRLDGLKRINLHAASGDGSKLRELIAYSTFNEAGVDAPRAMPARVFVNQQYQGIFIAVEEVDGRYTKAHFPDAADGNLYKQTWPNATLEAEEFAEALETNEELADVSDMLAFARAVGDASAETFAEQLGEFVDFDALLRYLAVDRAIRNWDGIMAFYQPETPHNFYWYHDDGAENRFHLIPWDLDNTFWEFDPYMHPEQWVTALPVPDWNTEPVNCEPRPVWSADSNTRVMPPRCDALLDLLAETQWSRFVEIGEELRNGPLSAAALSAKVTYWQSRIAPLVAQDPTVDAVTWQWEVQKLGIIFQDLNGDFKGFLDGGLLQEPPPPQEEEDLPSEVLDAASHDDGLLVNAVTNFEFDSAPTGDIAGVTIEGEYSTFASSWNTSAPLSGNADLLLDFTFKSQPGPYNEWVNLTFASAETDVSGFDSVVLTLSSDVRRTLRIRVASSAYEEAFGGVWSEFGNEVMVDATPRRVVLSLKNLYYPDWAKAPWSGTQGWKGSDAEARLLALQRFTGLVFAPSPTLDSKGELTAEEESGHLQIDNIYFR